VRGCDASPSPFPSPSHLRVMSGFLRQNTCEVKSKNEKEKKEMNTHTKLFLRNVIEIFQFHQPLKGGIGSKQGKKKKKEEKKTA
jgi:hypothetical protein